MKRANIYDAESREYTSYLCIINENTGLFTILDKNSDNKIAYGNIRGNRIDVYDAKTDELIEQGNLSGQRFNLSDLKTGKCTKYGMFL